MSVLRLILIKCLDAHLVKVATKEFDNPGRHASDNALKRGLNLPRKAQRVDFKRQMRARNDPAFIDFQMKMRRTNVVHPIPDMFLQQMRTVSKHDLEEDAAWLFAPIGVLSHVERDAINLGQLKAFAAKFNLPIVRWRNELVDGSAFEAHSIRDELFNHERNLWSYFVEGAPVLLGKTIKSVRKLVNGSPGLLDSLNVINVADLQRIQDGYNTGFDKNMVAYAREHAISRQCGCRRNGGCTNPVARSTTPGPLKAHSRTYRTPEYGRF